MNHFAALLKLTQHWKSILQYQRKKLKSKKR